MAVRYSVASLRRAGFVGGGQSLQFATRADSGVALAAFQAASTAAEAPYLDADDVVATLSITRAPGGPVAYMHLCDTAELLEDYLRVVARHLEAAGLSGRLQPAKSQDSPRVWAPALTAVLQLELPYRQMLDSPHDVDFPGVGWWVEDDRTDRVVPALVDWCLDTPGEAYLFTGFGMRLPPSEVAPILLDSLHRGGHAKLTRITEDRRRLRRLVFDIYGAVMVQTYDPDQAWQAHRDALQQPLRHAAPDVWNAFVRPLNSGVIGRYQAWEEPPATPLAARRALGSRMWFITHLERDYLPDAYGQQVVTGAHLLRLGELPSERWMVEDLGRDRYLVTARDLAAWFDVDPRPYGGEDTHFSRPAPPDPDTLAQARADFADAILTADVLRAHPTPPMTGPRRDW